MPEDVADAVAARLERSQILHRTGRRFVMVVEEAALHHQVCDADAMAAQLGYLLTAGALPAVSLGVIPASVSSRRIWPMETFHMYDESLVSVELLSARVKVEQPSEIELYRKAFAQLQSLAVVGAEARALIVAAIDRLG
jgi:hypothetical protein